MKLTDYMKQRFASGSAPDLRTLQRVIDDGEICGKRIGKKYFIEVDAQCNELTPLEKELMTHG